MVSIILRGSQTPRTAQTPAQFTMPGFAWRLSDVQVMQVTNFVRQLGQSRAGVVLKEIAPLLTQHTNGRERSCASLRSRLGDLGGQTSGGCPISGLLGGTSLIR